MQAGENLVDVAILGAGVAGCACALALRQAGVARVLVLDRADARADRRTDTPSRAIGESATPDVALSLAQLGLDADLGQLGHLPYYANLSAWGSSQLQHDPFLRRGQPHGWHLDRAAFNAWMREQAKAHGVLLQTPAQLSALTPVAALAGGGQGWQLQLAAQPPVQARVVVDASGRRAALVQHLGLKTRRLDSLVAIACRTAASNALAGVSLVESCPWGWWYAACVPGDQAVVMFMTDPDLARQLNFWQAWQQTTHLSQYLPVPDAASQAATRLQRFAAHSSFLAQAAGSNWLAVGDALLAFDPLTSSGIAAALNDALASVPLVLAQLSGQRQAIQSAGSVYARRSNSSLQRYLQGLRQHYGQEMRWPDQPFWARRSLARAA
jgi:flavin-dependent dehydrogenase